MGANSDYVSKMKTQLQKWDADVDALAAKGENASAEARSIYQEQIRELRASRDAAQKSFQEMRAAGEAAGAKMKVGMEEAWKAMKKGLDRASSNFKE